MQGCLGGASEDGWDPTTWVLNTSRWTPLELSGPSPRYGASMVWHNGDLWLYGGVSAVESVLSDVWRFDPTTYTWTLSASDASAGARAFHSLFSLDLGLTIFAGTGNGAIAGSTWSATSEALDWSVVPLQDTPSVRRGASLFAVGQNRLWLAGGVGTSGAPKVDVWKATVSADATDWEQFQPPFPATLDSAVAYRPDTEVIYIHGGKDTDGTSVSELWSWSPVSGPVITSTGLPTASQHAMYGMLQGLGCSDIMQGSYGVGTQILMTSVRCQRMATYRPPPLGNDCFSLTMAQHCTCSTHSRVRSGHYRSRQVTGPWLRLA